jgi:hypothetical protein
MKKAAPDGTAVIIQALDIKLAGHPCGREDVMESNDNLT